ncbi:MAG: hypothetical protein MUF25_09225 [Pirellulaceae bacterium]|nr:hypothetical protein [Pirellulaceae bacterium]
MKDIAVFRCLALAVALAGSARVLAGEDVGVWQPLPKEFKPAGTSETRVSLHQGNTWAYLRSPQDHSNREVAGTVTIDSPATRFDFFGSSWSARHVKDRFTTKSTLAAWLKPAAEMGKSQHGDKGDIIGYGARRFILGLQSQTAPYSLVARINVKDRIEDRPGGQPLVPRGHDLPAVRRTLARPAVS